jgi:sortase A
MTRETSRPRLAWIERTLYAVSVILIGGWAAIQLDASLYGYFQERRLTKMISEQRVAPEPAPGMPPPARRFIPVDPLPVETPAPRRPAVPIAEQDLVGRIEIPRLNLRAIIAEGIDTRTLRRAVGHLPGTPLPGEQGNVVLAGHRDTFFRALKDVRQDDIVRITTPRGRYEYVVEATAVVEPTRTDVLDATEEPSVTLVTCYPFYLVGDAPDRFVVRARLIAAGAGD